MVKHIWQRSFWLGCIGLFLTVSFITGVYGYIQYQNIEANVRNSSLLTIRHIPRPTTAPSQLLSSTSAVAGAATSIAKPLTVALYNGTNINGATHSYESKLQALPGMKERLHIVKKQYAVYRDYEGISIVVIKQDRLKDIQSLASLLGLPLGNLRPGEVTPQADVLIIIGQEK